MGQAYILVETEEKRLTLQSVLQDKGEGIVVLPIAAVVEVKNVDQLALGEEGFLFKPVPASHDVLKKILAGGRKDIFLAFDSSERGEYSSWLWAGMIGQLSKGALQCRRLHMASLDDNGFTAAIQGGEAIDSGQAAGFYFEECFQRSLATHLDRLLGTRLGPGGIPLSIPVLATLALVAEREQEVREFSGTPKWHVELSLQGPKGVFSAQLQEVVGLCSDGALEGTKQAKAVAGDLEKLSFQVVSRQDNSLKISAPQAYNLYELIFDAYCYCQIPMGEAMQAATMLHAGVSFDGGRQGLISSLYPVVLDSMQPLAEAAEQQVVGRFGQEAAHGRPLVDYGIMPLHPEIGPDEMSGLPEVVRKIYDLIWRRALASQMDDAVGTEIILDLQAEKFRLHTDCPNVEELGFLQIYQYGFSNLFSSQADAMLQEGEDATVVKVVPEQRLAMAPDLYTLPSLADDLAELGFARQEEVIKILVRLCTAGYVKAETNGIIQCDSNLPKVLNTLNRAFPGMQGLNLIVYYAQTIDEVLSGRKGFQMALNQFDQTLNIQGKCLVKAKIPSVPSPRLHTSKSIIKGESKPLRPAKDAAPSVPAEAALTDFSRGAEEGDGKGEGGAIAPESDVQEVVIPPASDQDAGLKKVEAHDKESASQAGDEESEQLPLAQNGETVSLDEKAKEQADSGHPEENQQVFQEAEVVEEPLPSPVAGQDELEAFSPPQNKDGQEKGIEEVVTKPCPECSRPMVLKGDSFGKYWACTGIPACRYTEKDINTEDGEESLSCPLCHQGQLVVKRTPTGKDMYVCPRESCEFMAWSKPHAIHCPLCSSPFLVEKKGVGGKVILRCPKAGCNYRHAIDGSQEQEAAVKKKKVVVRRTKGSGAGGGKRKVVVRRKK